MKQLQDWSCDFKLDSSTALTVGQKFAILCQGDTALNTTLKPEIVFDTEDDDYKLVVLRHKYKSSNELFVSLTSWQTGQHNFRSLKLELGNDYILLQPPQITVKSLLKGNEQMNLPPEPIFKSPPEFVWYFLGLVLFVSGIYFLKMYKKSRQIDRGLLRLNTFKTSLSPFYEFQKQIRATKKTLEKSQDHKELKELCTQFYKSLVIFISLQVQSPLFVLNEKEISSVLNKKISDPKFIKDYFYITKELKKTAQEIGENSDIKTLQADFENLLDESNIFSQKINKYFLGAARV